MYLKLSIALAFLSCSLNFAMDGHDYEQVMFEDRNSFNNQTCVDLANRVDELIEQKVESGDKELMHALFASIDLQCNNVTDKILDYGIDDSLALIKAIEIANIPAIIILATEIDPSIISKLKLIIAENNEENPLKKAMSILLDEKTDLNKLNIKHLSDYKDLDSSWSKSIVSALEQVLFNT